MITKAGVTPLERAETTLFCNEGYLRLGQTHSDTEIGQAATFRHLRADFGP